MTESSRCQQNQDARSSLAVQWLGLLTFISEGAGSTKILLSHRVWPRRRKQKSRCLFQPVYNQEDLSLGFPSGPVANNLPALYNTGSPVWCSDNLEGGDGGGRQERGSRGRGYIYIYVVTTDLSYGRKQHNVVN